MVLFHAVKRFVEDDRGLTLVNYTGDNFGTSDLHNASIEAENFGVAVTGNKVAVDPDRQTILALGK